MQIHSKLNKIKDLLMRVKMSTHSPSLQSCQALHHHITTVLCEKDDLIGVDKLDVQEAIDYAERELTEHQKASLQIYAKNKQSIDQVLEQISAGLTELQVGEKDSSVIGLHEE